MSESESEEFQPDPTTELTEQVQTLRQELDSVKAGLNSVFYAFIAFVLAGFICFVLYTIFDKPTKPDNEIKDYTTSNLLREGPHCYTERAEMLASRQRALEAVDRIRWQREHPEVRSDNQMSLPSAVDATPIPTVRAIFEEEGLQAQDEKNVDPTLCFYVQYGERKWGQ